MKDKNSVNKENEIDFVSSPSLQNALKKSKRKQIIKMILLVLVTTSFLLISSYFGSHYLLNKKIENNLSDFGTVYGANIYYSSSTYQYNIFSVTEESTFRKSIGDRSIVWKKSEKKIPLIGKVIDEKGSVSVETITFNEKAKRHVRYNDFNNQRKIDFYYPLISYDYFPDELAIAVDLDKNKLIEVAFSFKESMTITDVYNLLGNQNVNWLWVDTTTNARMKKWKMS